MPSQWNPITSSEVEITDGFNNAALASGIVPSGAYGLVTYVANPTNISLSGINLNGATVAVSGIVNTSGNTIITYAQPISDPYNEKAFNFSLSGDNSIIGSSVGQTIRIYSLLLTTSGTTNLTFKPGTISQTGPLNLNAGGSIVLDLRPAPWFTTAISSGFIINSTTATNIAGIAYYTQS